VAVFGRSKKDEADEEFVSLSDDTHAWWAARDDLKRAWSPPEKDGSGVPEAQPSQFESEFSAESLFSWADGTDTFTEPGSYESKAPLVAPDGSDPYAVLGVSPDASWSEIVAAHRHLAKLHHPDRLLSVDGESRAQSEQTMRLVNAAYLQLRRHNDAQ
jgi:hypothetical protein